MAGEFGSFADFGGFLNRVARAVPRETSTTLDQIGLSVVELAKSKIGTYQPAVTSPQGTAFAAWAPLAASTLEDKFILGYSPPDNPLKRTGLYRDSIDMQRDLHFEGTSVMQAVTVFSDTPYAIEHEYGTVKMPPRPVLGPAMAQHVPESLVKIVDGLDRAFARGR